MPDTDESKQPSGLSYQVVATLTVAALSLGGFTGNVVTGQGGKEAAAAMATMSQEVAVLSTRMDAQAALAKERAEAAATKAAALDKKIESLKDIFQKGTQDRYPRAQAVTELASVREEIRDAKSGLSVHTALQGHPQTVTKLEELTRRLGLAEEEIRKLREDFLKRSKD